MPQSSKYEATMFDGMSFPEISDWSAIKIVGYKIGVLIGTRSLSTSNPDSSYGLVGRFITDYYDVRGQSSHPEYTAISNEDIRLLPQNDKDTSMRWVYVENVNELSPEIVWMNANKETVAAGTQFGLRTYGQCYKLAKIGMQIYYVPANKIYVGNKKASAIYIGSTKASAIYIGNTKVL